MDNCGAFARLVIPGGCGFVLPGGRVYANSRATLELLAHTCIPIQTYKLLNMEDFTGNTSRFKDWLICQGQEKLEYTV